MLFRQISPGIELLGQRLDEELHRIEQETTAGLNLATAILERFSNKATLIQFLAYLSSAKLLADMNRRKIRTIMENFEANDVATFATNIIDIRHFNL